MAEIDGAQLEHTDFVQCDHENNPFCAERNDNILRGECGEPYCDIC